MSEVAISSAQTAESQLEKIDNTNLALASYWLPKSLWPAFASHLHPDSPDAEIDNTNLALASYWLPKSLWPAFASHLHPDSPDAAQQQLF